jgi:RNA polymerase sigma-70 factor (sigma-E family)
MMSRRRGGRSVSDFETYVKAAWPRLLRSAWLLTGDWPRAEDLLQTVLARAWGRWPRLRDGQPDAYLRRMLATTYLTWWRRRWRGEIPAADLPEAAGWDPYADSDLRMAVIRALHALPPKQRAVVMLRFHADLTEVDTADALGITVGTVKSHTARALAALRVDPELRATMIEERP